MVKRVAIITGASSGIGAETAILLAQHNYNLIITYNANKVGGESTLEKCKQSDNEVILVKADVSQDADCSRIINTAISKWGRLDVLINNAGTTRFVAADNLNGLDAADFEHIFSVNVTGCYQMTRAAAPHLQKERGSVVNISSHSAFSGIGSSMPYAASKGALNTLTLSFARTLAPDVRVNAVCPGFVDNDWMASALSSKDLARLKKRTASLAPLKRIPSAADIAKTALWFALGTVPVTGQMLVVDGGTHLTVGDPL